MIGGLRGCGRRSRTPVQIRGGGGLFGAAAGRGEVHDWSGQCVERGQRLREVAELCKGHLASVKAQSPRWKTTRLVHYTVNSRPPRLERLGEVGELGVSRGLAMLRSRLRVFPLLSRMDCIGVHAPNAPRRPLRAASLAEPDALHLHMQPGDLALQLADAREVRPEVVFGLVKWWAEELALAVWSRRNDDPRDGSRERVVNGLW